jgi:hypothetical protein
VLKRLLQTVFRVSKKPNNQYDYNVALEAKRL